MKNKCVIGITIGDPAGIGPEIIIKSIINLKITGFDFVPVLFGSVQVFEFYRDLFGLDMQFVPLNKKEDIKYEDKVYVIDVNPEASFSVSPGYPDNNGSLLALEAIKQAVYSALDSKIDAIVTAPIYKKGINEAGCDFHGHTGFLAYLTKTKNYAMMLAGGGLKVVLATIHIPLREVFGKLTPDRVYEAIKISHEGLRMAGITEPRIAVCALNPHAGEEGLLGNEEILIIKPAVDKAIAEGINVTGIFPSDTVFWDTLQGKSDIVVAMYHDQGLIPIKTLAFDSGVNVTLGLPIIRTSPDHGTAFDIAGKNIATSASMEQAIKFAMELCRGKRS